MGRTTTRIAKKIAGRPAIGGVLLWLLCVGCASSVDELELSADGSGWLKREYDFAGLAPLFPHFGGDSAQQITDPLHRLLYRLGTVARLDTTVYLIDLIPAEETRPRGVDRTELLLSVTNSMRKLEIPKNAEEEAEIAALANRLVHFCLRFEVDRERGLYRARHESNFAQLNDHLGINQFFSRVMQLAGRNNRFNGVERAFITTFLRAPLDFSLRGDELELFGRAATPLDVTNPQNRELRAILPYVGEAGDYLLTVRFPRRIRPIKGAGIEKIDKRTARIVIPAGQLYDPEFFFDGLIRFK